MKMTTLIEMILIYNAVLQQTHKKQEKFLFQQLGYIFLENPITGWWFDGLNKHILISDNFETPNFEIVINANSYISITDDDSMVWYQITTGSEIKLPYNRPVLDFAWDEFDIETIINSFTSEVDLHRFKELLEVEVALLKQRLWLLKKSSLKLEIIQDEKLIQEIISLREVS